MTTTNDPTEALRSLGFRAPTEALRALLTHATKSALSPVALCLELAAQGLSVSAPADAPPVSAADAPR